MDKYVYFYKYVHVYDECVYESISIYTYMFAHSYDEYVYEWIIMYMQVDTSIQIYNICGKFM